MIKLILISLLGSKVVSARVLFNSIKFYLIIYMLILPPIIKAQDFDWVISRPLDFAFNPEMQNILVASNSQGDVFWAGMSVYHENYSTLAYGDLYFEKYTAEGDLEDYSGAEGYAAIVEMEYTPEDMVVMVIHIRSSLEFDDGTVMPYSGTNGQLYLLKMSEDGEVQWYELIESDLSYMQSALAIDDAGGIYIGTGNFSTTKVLTYDGQGELITLVEQTGVSLISSIDVDSDYNVYVAGSCAGFEASFNGVDAEPEFSYSTYLAKYNNSAQLEWVKFIEDVTCPSPVVKCNDPDYVYFSGDLFLSTAFDDMVTGGPQWVFDFFVSRLNADGDFLWVKEVPEQSEITGDARLQKINFCNIDEENNVFVSGFIRGEIEWDNTTITSSTNITYDFLALKFNSYGLLEYANSGGGEGYDQAISSAIDPDGNFYLAGYGTGETNFGEQSAYEEGVHPILVKIKNSSIVSSVQRMSLSQAIHSVPNPVTDGSFVIDGIDGAEVISVRIINSQGNTVFQSKFPKQLEFSLAGNNSGVYIVLLQLTDSTTISQKILKN